jgi:hypothetical protein
MKRMVCIIFTVFLLTNVVGASPLIWRSAQTIPGGSAIFQMNLSYAQIARSWSWTTEEWSDIPDASKTTVMGAHFMLGYAPIPKLELLAHVPLMKKDRDTLSSFGLQDVWAKVRYNLIGEKAKPYITGVVAVRIPTASEDANPALDDRTLDIGAGLLYFQQFNNILIHIRTGYFYNGKTDADIDVGDDVEVFFKPEYVFNKKVKVFLAFSLVETFKAKDAGGTSIDNTQKRRFTLTPGLVATPAPGLKIRPKFVYPLEMVCQGGSNFAWQIGFDVWYVAKF